MSLERSPEITDKLETLRDIKSDTPEGKQEKIYTAMEIRLELSLDQAFLDKAMYESLRENPDITPEELLETVKDSGKILRPEVLERFAQELHRVSEKVSETETKLISKHGAENVGNAIFSSLMRTHNRAAWNSGPKTPDGNVTYVRYPLALGIMVDTPDDFGRIDPGRNLAGFFTHEDNYVVEDGPNPIPTIAVKAIAQAQKVSDHEEGHSVNNAIKICAYRDLNQAVEEQRREDLVAKTAADHLRVLWDESTEEQRLQIYETAPYKILLNHALELAKDELLAEMYAPEGNVTEHMGHLQKSKTYDYFAHLGMDTSSGVYINIKATYDTELDELTYAARKLSESYGDWFTARKEMLPWMLNRVELKDWATVIERRGLLQEAQDIDSTRWFINMAKQNLQIPEDLMGTPGLELSQRESVLLGLALTAERQMNELFEDGQTTSIRRDLAAIRQVTIPIEPEVVSSRMSRINSTLERYQDIVEIYRQKAPANIGSEAAQTYAQMIEEIKNTGEVEGTFAKYEDRFAAYNSYGNNAKN